MKEHLENSNILLHQIYDNDDYIIPPWKLSSPIIDLTLHSSYKKETTDSVFKQRFLEIKDSYENKGFTPIYTDGSKSDKYVSASVVSSADIYKVNLPDHSTIFTAEAVVLKLAVQHIQRQVIPKSVIFSDSLSCVQALQGKNLNHPVICEILEILTYLSKVNTEVVFCWIPGHIGIKGNEKADKIAKQIIDIPTMISKFLFQTVNHKSLNMLNPCFRKSGMTATTTNCMKLILNSHQRYSYIQITERRM